MIHFQRDTYFNSAFFVYEKEVHLCMLAQISFIESGGVDNGFP